MRKPAGPSKGAGSAEPSWFHVVHRGVGRRPVFSAAVDIQRLLELLGQEAAHGTLELHAYTILANHCHLLVLAPPRALPGGLQRVFAVYSRHVNRRLRRDGPLFGSRARVRRIRSAWHWRATVAYIDRNPVEAGLVRQAARYPHGSAWHYARPSGPSWLRRDVIEDFVRQEAGAERYSAKDYARLFGDRGAPSGASSVVERRLGDRDDEDDPLDDLLAAAPGDVRRWLERMALRADGAAAGPALVDSRTVLRVIERLHREQGVWNLQPHRAPGRAFAPTRAQRGGVRRNGWSVLACGLLRTACGLSLEEIGDSVGLSMAGAYLQIQCHRRLVSLDDAYKQRAEAVLTAALTLDFPDLLAERPS